MLLDDIKRRITQAMKEKDDVAKNILRLAVGEIQMAETRSGRPTTEDEAAGIVRKLVKSNEETLVNTTGDAAEILKKENVLLLALLPASLTVDQIVEALASQVEAIRAAKNDGQATGLAMKHLKTAGVTTDGTTVGAAVKQIRA